jgi:hypothetical protein
MDDALVDLAAVEFDLALTGASQKSAASTLTLQVRPRSYKPRALVLQGRKIDLYATFFCLGACAENLKDKASTVDDLYVPLFFKVSLLNRRERVVNDNDIRLGKLYFVGDFLAHTFAEKIARVNFREVDKPRPQNLKVDSVRQTFGLLHDI